MWFLRVHDKQVPPVSPDAEKAVQESKKALRQVKARDKEVHEVAEASRKFRRENHFAVDLQRAFGGRAT